MEIQQIQQIKKYIDIAIRRKVLIGMFVLIGAAAGLAFYLTQPKIYQSTALLSYQQQKVSPAKMSPDEQERIRDIVSTLSQIITSRTSLEKIITDLDLYKGQRQKYAMEDVIEIMRKNIDIKQSKEGDTFRISYTGGQPNQVVRAVNTLAAKFIEENLKYREERASETFSYTNSELDMTKEVLDRKEAVMRDYKLKYYNEMPDQRANNMSRLNSLQEQYQNRQDSIQDLERTRVLIQDQIAVRKQVMEDNAQLRKSMVSSGPVKTAVVETDTEKVNRLNNELENLLVRYTEKHPDVKLLKKKIKNLEEEIASKKTEKKSSQDDAGQDNTEHFDKALLELDLQLKEIGLSIKRLNEEKAKLKSIIEKYEAWVEAAPVREAEWSALTREYGELKRHYDFLVAQNLQAGSALNLERKQKGSQFKIEDSGRQPQKPIKPDFLKIMAMALALGAGAGGALAFGRDLLDSSFKDPSELETFLGVELICSVPRLSLKKEDNRAMIINIAWLILFLLSSATLAAAFIYFWKQGHIVI